MANFYKVKVPQNNKNVNEATNLKKSIKPMKQPYIKVNTVDGSIFVPQGIVKVQKERKKIYVYRKRKSTCLRKTAKLKVSIYGRKPPRRPPKK